MNLPYRTRKIMEGSPPQYWLIPVTVGYTVPFDNTSEEYLLKLNCYSTSVGMIVTFRRIIKGVGELTIIIAGDFISNEF